MLPKTFVSRITGVLVFDDGFKSGGSFELSETLIPVLDSDNKKALSRLKEMCIRDRLRTSKNARFLDNG